MIPGGAAGAEAHVGRRARRAGVRVWVIAAWGAALLYMALIFFLSSLSNPMPEVTTRIWDKLLHFTEYGTLGALLFLAFRAIGVGWRGAIGCALLGASLYGASDEFHQSFVPNRSCDLHDWYADSLGGALGAILAALALRVALARASIGRNRREG